MAEPLDDRSLGELLSELSRETGILVRKEVELAITEVTARLKVAGAHAGVAAAGGVLAHAGLLVILAALVIGLWEMGVAPWLAAAMVGAVATAVGYLLASNAVGRMRRTTIAPTHTIETLKETARWTTRQGA